MFSIEAEGPTSLSGGVIATSRNTLNAFMAEPDSKRGRSLTGRVDSTQKILTLEGKDHNGAAIRIRAVKQN